MIKEISTSIECCPTSRCDLLNRPIVERKGAWKKMKTTKESWVRAGETPVQQHFMPRPHVIWAPKRVFLWIWFPKRVSNEYGPLKELFYEYGPWKSCLWIWFPERVFYGKQKRGKRDTHGVLSTCRHLLPMVDARWCNVRETWRISWETPQRQLFLKDWGDLLFCP